MDNSLDWIRRNLKIVNKAGDLVQLIPNIGQLLLHKSIELQRSKGLPVRIILLKPRQVGWSTWSEAEGFYEINNRANRTALVVSADTEATDFVFNMTKRYQEYMRPEMKRRTDASNRKEIVYSSPWSSRFVTQTAGKDVLGRGGTVHFLHLSEFSFWRDAKAKLAGILQMVPTTPDSTVIIESTANGLGGAFYDLFWEGVEKRRFDPEDYAGFIPVFFPWHKFPEYILKPSKNLRLTEEEGALKANFSLTDGQIMWRRVKIAELNGDEGLFRQEYPSTAIEAFQTSGNPVFNAYMIKKQESKCIKDIITCVFTKDSYETVNRTLNCWKVFRFPESGHNYAMGIDTMEGRASDPDDAKSLLDYHGAVIFDRNEGEVVAVYQGRGNQQDVADQCLNAAKQYNEAWMAPEIPNGMVVLNVLKQAGYQNIYSRQVHDEQWTAEDTDNFGWRTTTITRSWLVDGLIGALRDDSIRIRFVDIVNEMKTFVRDKTGKPIHQPGKHDDLLFALMIALQVHVRCPMDLTPYPYSSTGDEPARKKIYNLSRIGAIDPGIEEEEDD